MHRDAFDPIHIPAPVWDRDESRIILKNRDISGLFKIAVKHAGASQVSISAATGLSQPRISAILRGQAGPITDLTVFERIATGLGLPDHARMLLGLAPLDIASPTGDVDDEHQEQSAELIARLKRLTE